MQVVDLDHVKRVVREAARLQPGRPALRIGLRAGLAVVAPLLVASRVGPMAATWATLGGFGVVLVDKGGAYRTRAIATSAAALGGALGVLLGTLVAGTHAVLPVIALGTAVCAMGAAFPGPAVSVGNTIAVQLIVASTFPADPARPHLPALAFLAGAAWSIVLALVLWPVRVYRPARHEASRALREVARHASDLAARGTTDPAVWREGLTRRHRPIRETFEAARAVLTATRRGRRGEIGRGARLLAIVEAADQIFGVLIGVEEVVDHLGDATRAAIAGEVDAGLLEVAERCGEVAERVLVEARLPPLPALAWTSEAARGRLDGLAPAERLEAVHALALVTRLLEDVAAVSAVVDSLDDEREPALPPGVERSADGDDPLSWSETLRGVLDRDSAVLRHALRVGIVAALSIVATRALDLPRGYWATLTAVLLLQPYLPATLTRGVQRVGGTILGGILASALAALVHDPLVIALLVIALAGVSAAVLSLNYGLYALFLTPTFVLMAEVNAPDVHLVELRIANTLLGAGLAVAGALLLWPTREGSRTGPQLAVALDAAADYVRAVFGVVASHVPTRSGTVIASRRRMGRALNHADLSLDRLAAEGPAFAALWRSASPQAAPEQLEPQLAVIAMTRRLASTVSAFGTSRHVADAAPANSSVDELIAQRGVDAEAFLRATARALGDGTSAPAYTRHDDLAVQLPALFATRLARVELQLSIIAEAAGRISPAATNLAALK